MYLNNYGGNMKSKSYCFKKMVDKIEDILSKLHTHTVDGTPLNPSHDEWNNTRDRLMKIKVGPEHFGTYPINFQLADHLILSELAHQPGADREHLTEFEERMKPVN